GHHRFIRIATADQFPSPTALQLSGPASRSFAKLLREKSLQLTKRNHAVRRHFCWLKTRISRQCIPVLDSKKPLAHRFPPFRPSNRLLAKGKQPLRGGFAAMLLLGGKRRRTSA